MAPDVDSHDFLTSVVNVHRSHYVDWCRMFMYMESECPEPLKGTYARKLRRSIVMNIPIFVVFDLRSDSLINPRIDRGGRRLAEAQKF